MLSDHGQMHLAELVMAERRLFFFDAKFGRSFDVVHTASEYADSSGILATTLYIIWPADISCRACLAGWSHVPALPPIALHRWLVNIVSPGPHHYMCGVDTRPTADVKPKAFFFAGPAG